MLMKPTTGQIAKTLLLFLLAVVAFKSNVFNIQERLLGEPELPEIETPSIFDQIFDFGTETPYENMGGGGGGFSSDFFSLMNVGIALPQVKNYRAMKDDNIREYNKQKGYGTKVQF